LQHQFADAEHGAYTKVQPITQSKRFRAKSRNRRDIRRECGDALPAVNGRLHAPVEFSPNAHHSPAA